MRFYPSRALALVLAGCLGLPAASLAQSVTVNVNAATKIRTVDERVFGVNAVLWDPETANTQTISLLQAAGLRAIRIPGGSLSDEYHWRTNTNLTNTWTWASGFDRFANLITGLNAQAFVTVNYGTGTPEEAAAWVAYANGLASLQGSSADVNLGTDAKGFDWGTAGRWSALRAAAPLSSNDGMNFLRLTRPAAFGLKYWEIGNECYGTWESDEQAVQHDAFTYATRAKAYIQKMKAVDPTIKVGVVVVPSETDYANGNTGHPATNPRTGVVSNGWTPVMLTTLKNLGVTPDFVIYHRYEQAPAADQPNNSENDANLLQKAKTWPDDAATLRRQLTDYLGSSGASVEIVVTENNSVYGKPGKQTTSLVNGLYLADSIGQVLQTEINGLVWWDLRNGQETGNNNSSSLYGWRNYGDYGVLSTPRNGGSSTYFEPYPTYYALKLLGRFARQDDTVVQATSSSSLLSVFAVKTTAGALKLLVINKDPSSATTASIFLSGFSPADSGVVTSYGKVQDDAAKPGGNGVVEILDSLVAVGGASFSATFPSYSITVISINAASSTPSTPTTPTPTTPSTPSTPTTPTPTTPSTPSSGSGGGGGGGAPSLWFLAALAALATGRLLRNRK